MSAYNQQYVLASQMAAAAQQQQQQHHQQAVHQAQQAAQAAHAQQQAAQQQAAQQQAQQAAQAAAELQHAQAAQLELGPNPNAMAIKRPFDPTAHDLDANFRLTRFADFFSVLIARLSFSPRVFELLCLVSISCFMSVHVSFNMLTSVLLIQKQTSYLLPTLILVRYNYTI